LWQVIGNELVGLNTLPQVFAAGFEIYLFTTMMKKSL
jgi:hypothetical protein